MSVLSGHAASAAAFAWWSAAELTELVDLARRVARGGSVHIDLGSEFEVVGDQVRRLYGSCFANAADAANAATADTDAAHAADAADAQRLLPPPAATATTTTTSSQRSVTDTMRKTKRTAVTAVESSKQQQQQQQQQKPPPQPAPQHQTPPQAGVQRRRRTLDAIAERFDDDDGDGDGDVPHDASSSAWDEAMAAEAAAAAAAAQAIATAATPSVFDFDGDDDDELPGASGAAKRVAVLSVMPRAIVPAGSSPLVRRAATAAHHRPSASDLQRELMRAPRGQRTTTTLSDLMGPIGAKPAGLLGGAVTASTGDPASAAGNPTQRRLDDLVNTFVSDVQAKRAAAATASAGESAASADQLAGDTARPPAGARTRARRL